MRRILATTAIAALTAAPTFAESQSNTQNDQNLSAEAGMDEQTSNTQKSGDLTADKDGMKFKASNLLGQPIYIRSAEQAGTEIADSISAPDQGWERAGEVGDVIISKDGEITSVTLDAGGFLGMNEKHVETSLDELKFVTAEDDMTNFYIVFTGDRSALEQRGVLDMDAARDEGRTFYDADGWTRTAGSYSPVAAKDGADAGTDNAQASQKMTGQQSTALDITEAEILTASDLQGATVYGETDEQIGEISNLVLDDEGNITKVVIDVGGFLGIGEKPVALPLEEVTLMQDTEGLDTSYSASTEYTQQDLENMQSWAG